MTKLQAIQSRIRAHANAKQAEIAQWFFKTGKGEYGEGDQFLGIRNPILRRIAKEFRDLDLRTIEVLLRSRFHDERQIALFVLVDQYAHGNAAARAAIYNFYLARTDRVNNWDLVDSSAYKIIGKHLLDRPKSILIALAKSENIWKRRIAIIATLEFIAHGEYSTTFHIAKILLRDEHGLIHKAVGWMLREVGKRDRAAEEKFLQKHYRVMPRTMLRYAVEKFPERHRKAYLAGIV